MTQSKRSPAKVSVRLLCILSGDGQAWAKGETVSVEAAEADRLIGLGAAEAVAKK